jgi:hypothetical protein
MIPLLLRLVVVASPTDAVNVLTEPQGLLDVPIFFPPAEEEMILPPDDIPALMVLFTNKSFVVSEFAVIHKPIDTFSRV